MGKRRRVTETEAWCNNGQHMVAHAGFAKGQRICRECRKVYNFTSNYSQGKTCSKCGVPIANTNRGGHCMTHHREKVLRERGSGPVRRYINAQGYVRLTAHYWHPNSSPRGEILEHTKVMSEVLGRPLLPGENVHHLNGDRTDNRPENLELWTKKQPPGQRVADKVQWAKDLLALYEPDALAVPQLRYIDELSA